MRYMPVVNKIWFCVFRRASSHKGGVFLHIFSIQSFPVIIIVITFTSFVNYRNEEQKVIQGNVQETIRKKGKAPMQKDRGMAPLYTAITCNRDKKMHQRSPDQKTEVAEKTCSRRKASNYSATLKPRKLQESNDKNKMEIER